MAARFTSASDPFDTASWMDIWGPARTILQQCVGFKSVGGVIAENGTCGESRLISSVLMIY